MLKSEWSHRIDIEEILKKDKIFEIEASEDECRDLARRFLVDTLSDLKARLVVKRQAGGHVLHVTGEFSASVGQTCIVSAEPVSQAIAGAVEGWFSEEERAVSLSKARRERMVTHLDSEIQIADEKDDPEAVIDGQIDLGELVVQHLALEIDSYPQKDGVLAQDYADKLSEPEEEVRHNPFAALKDWKDKKRK